MVDRIGKREAILIDGKECGAGAGCCYTGAQLEAAQALVQEMAMLIKQMAYNDRYATSDSSAGTVRDKALDFLRRHGLERSPLREGESQ